MTKSTDTKNITKIVKAILQSNGIDNDTSLKLEIDLIEAWKRYLFEREEGESPAVARERVTEDYVSKVIEHAQAGASMVEYRNRIERAMGLNPNWDDTKQDWSGFDLWLKKKEGQGQTIESFMAWWKSDEFRAKGSIWLNPQKVKLMWGQAFVHKTDEQRPEYKRYEPEQINAVPNPLRKPRL